MNFITPIRLIALPFILLNLMSCSHFVSEQEVTLDDVVSVVRIDDDMLNLNNEIGINTSNINCLRDLAYLKEMNSKEYSSLFASYSTIAAHARFFDESLDVMNHDMKETYSAKLIIKKDQLCEKISRSVARKIKSTIG